MPVPKGHVRKKSRNVLEDLEKLREERKAAIQAKQPKYRPHDPGFAEAARASSARRADAAARSRRRRGAVVPGWCGRADAAGRSRRRRVDATGGGRADAAGPSRRRRVDAARGSRSR